MTTKQFQGFIRLALIMLNEALKESPDNKILKEVIEILQIASEDDDQ